MNAVRRTALSSLSLFLVVAAGCASADHGQAPASDDPTVSAQAHGENGLTGAPEHVAPQKDARGAKPGGSPLMTNHGGPVLTATRVKPIFWGSQWNDASWAGDKKSGIEHFFNAIGGSRYASTGTEYGSTATVTPLASDVDTSAPPSKALSTSGAVAEACKYVDSSTTSDDIFFIYTATGAGHVSYCAWHSHGTCANGTHVQVAYMPNIDGIAGCDPGDATTGHSEGLAALANVTSHELLEAMTDPRLNAWYDASGNENADKCAWSFPTANDGLSTLYDGTQWKLQMEWSNAAFTAGSGELNRSGQAGCVY